MSRQKCSVCHEWTRIQHFACHKNRQTQRKSRERYISFIQTSLQVARYCAFGERGVRPILDNPHAHALAVSMSVNYQHQITFITKKSSPIFLLTIQSYLAFRYVTCQSYCLSHDVVVSPAALLQWSWFDSKYEKQRLKFTLTDTSFFSARQSLVPRMTGTNVRSVSVLAVGVGAAELRCVHAFVDVLVTVGSSPARKKVARRTAGSFVASGVFTTTEILAVPTPALGRTH